MMKRIFFVLFLALQAAAVTGVASAHLPWPTCGECPNAK